MAEQEPADIVDQVGVGEQVLEQVGVHAAAGEHADGTVEPFGHVGGRFECLPGAFEEVAVLRVHECRISGSDPEELAVEPGDVVDQSVAQHAIGIPCLSRIEAVANQLLGVEIDEAVVAGNDPSPELVDVPCAGKPARHADDRDIGVIDRLSAHPRLRSAWRRRAPRSVA
ncbi:MAG: hypothetical protein R2697_11115 [Ilumatobacteraceae bacterium]